jgi:hypothetical protein
MGQPRLNIYVDDQDVRDKVRVAAARRGITQSAYCLEAIRHRLAEEGYLPGGEAEARSAADRLDQLRKRVGPIGIRVSDLISEGRR